MDKMRIKISDLLLCLSGAQYAISPVVSRHHQQVAYLSYRICEQLNVSFRERQDIYLAALVHDAGALSIREKFEIIESEPIHVNRHAFRSARLFEDYSLLKPASKIIRYHHVPWNYGEGQKYRDEDVPIGSHIIHLADRTCLKLNFKKNVLSQVPEVLDDIRLQSGFLFSPELVQAMMDLKEIEYIWLDLAAEHPVRNMMGDVLHSADLGIDDIVSIAQIFSRIIDFRSKSTSRHSAGVAKTAEKIAEIMGFSPNECKKMRVAGYLHDLGKLVIRDEILEKPGKLAPEEYCEMKSHTYNTFQLLSLIPQFQEINAWASYHHERLDGSGYPFHLKGEGLPLGSRIVAVADVFTALKEDRPYRKGMDDDAAKKVLWDMAVGGALDAKVISVLFDHYELLNQLRRQTQREAEVQYKEFWGNEAV